MKTYSVSPIQFSALRTRLMELGVTLPAESDGVISHSGIELKYHYDGAVLTLSVQKRPMLLPVSFIWTQVDKWIGA